MAKKVFLGLSGGVDSAVSAALLKTEGYEVVGVYMKNWSQDLPGMECPWARDLADAKRVAVDLDLDFRVYDFEKSYREKVVEYMLAEYKKGNTPNPDIMCNKEIKFDLFYDRAMSEGADYIATGHYARTDGNNLLRAVDENKDQTYFLYRMPEKALEKTLFPIGHLTKPEVKKLASDYGLHVAKKSESMGVCFVGEVGIREFLSEYFEITPGEIRDEQTNEVLGTHDGVIFYTLGQRHGLYLGGGLPYYVSKKDTTTNTLFVTTDLNSLSLWTNELRLSDTLIRNAPGDARESLVGCTTISAIYPPARTTTYIPAGTDKVALRSLPDSQRMTSSAESGFAEVVVHPTKDSGDPSIPIMVRLRHRAPLISATINLDTNTLSFESPERTPSPGQSAVFYGTGKNANICLGGGIITSKA